ncbi:MAG: hypothetical protein R3B48_08595 [Kofleriaceae bacterium]
MKLVMALAAVLVVALVALALWLTASPDQPVSATPPPPPERPTQVHAPSPSIVVRTEPTSQARTSSEPARPPMDVYSVGGVTIHDATGGPPATRAPSTTPPEGVRLPPQLAQDVTTMVEPAARQCAQTIPETSRTPETKLHVTMTVAVKNGSLTVNDVAAKVNGLDEPAMMATVKCLRERMIGTNVDAAGQPDVPSYLISTYYLAK